MEKKNKSKKRRKTTGPISEIGKGVPKNLKFAMLITLVIFWAEAIRTFLDLVFNMTFQTDNPLFLDVVMALIVSIIIYLVFIGWRKIGIFLEKIKLPKEFERI
jgi:hypothetical protein